MSNTENSLMKQTKKELISIILRKDDIEKKLNKKLADVELDLNKAKSMIGEKEYTIKDLKLDLEVSNDIVKQHQNTINKLTIVNTDVEHSLRNAKRWNIVLAILFACAVAVAIVF